MSYHLLELSLCIEKPATFIISYIFLLNAALMFICDEEIGLGQTIRYVQIQRIPFIAYNP